MTLNQIYFVTNCTNFYLDVYESLQSQCQATSSSLFCNKLLKTSLSTRTQSLSSTIGHMILNQVYFVTNCVNVYVLMYMRAFSHIVKHRRGLEGEQVLGVVYLGGCVSWGTGGWELMAG